MNTGGFNGRRDLWTKVVADPRRAEVREGLVDFMRRSRAFRRDPPRLLELQAEMVGALLNLEHSKGQSEMQALGHAQTEAISEAAVDTGLSKLLICAVRSIGDGIAWRALDYDRAALKLLSLKPQTGYLDHSSVLQEVGVASEYVEGGGNLVIVNDLTNFLRYGDLTVVSTEGVGIIEVKGGKSSSRSRRARRQSKALETVIARLNQGEWETDEGVGRIRRLRATPNAHLLEVAHLIEEAKSRGAANARLSDCTAVDVWYMPVLVNAADPEEAHRFLHDPFSQSKDAYTYNRVEYLDKFSINLAPYSIYPFSQEDCVDLMIGDLLIWTHFSHGNLRRCLKRRDLFVRWPSDDEFEAYDRLTLAEKHQRMDDVALRVARHGGTDEMLVELGLLGRLPYEFLDEESFADGLEELLDMSRDDEHPALYFDAFQREADLWD